LDVVIEVVVNRTWWITLLQGLCHASPTLYGVAYILTEVYGSWDTVGGFVVVDDFVRVRVYILNVEILET
jgi:hypothetical protein